MAYRDSTTNGATSGTTSSVNVPAGVVAGDIVILKLSRDSTTAFGTWPAGFTEFLNVALSVVDTQRVGAAWKRLTAADTGTYTCGAAPGANDWVMQATAYSGRHATDPPVLSSTTNDAANAIGAGLAITAPSVTALAGDDLEFACLPDTSVADGTVATAPPSGYTEAKDQEANFGYAENAYKENVLAGATGTVAGTLTASGGNAGYVAVHIRIPAAVSSGSIPPPSTRQPSLPTLNPGGVPMAQILLAPGKSTSYGPVRWQNWESYPWSAPAAASIDIASAGTLSVMGSAAATAIGTVAAAGTVTITGATPLTATGTIASAGTLLITGAAAATSTGALVSAGTAVIVGAAVLTSQGAIASAGALTVTGTAALTGVGSLAAAGTAVINGAANLTAPSVNDISSAGSIVITSSAALSAIGSLAASGALVITGVARLDDGAIVVTTEPPNAGGWPIFALRYEQELARRRRKKREQDELEQESRALQNQLDREIALLLREQEAKDAKRDELERVKALAEHLSTAEAQAQYGERVAKALERATIRGNYSALEALDREIQRARQEEEWLVTAMMFLIEDNDA